MGRLFIMLKYFPIESKGRQQKLREVGRVASICFCCFSARCIMVRIFVHWKLCRFSTQNSFMKFALYFLCRCASMHLMKKLTSMFLTIQFWISSITWYVWILQNMKLCVLFQFGHSKLMPTVTRCSTVACWNSSFISCPVHSEEDSCKTTAITVSPPQQRLETRHCHLLSWMSYAKSTATPFV